MTYSITQHGDIPVRTGNNLEVVTFCYLCRKCGQWHPIGVECKGTRRSNTYESVRRYKSLCESQARELKDLLEMKRYFLNHKEWKEFYASGYRNYTSK